MDIPVLNSMIYGRPYIKHSTQYKIIKSKSIRWNSFKTYYGLATFL